MHERTLPHGLWIALKQVDLSGSGRAAGKRGTRGWCWVPSASTVHAPWRRNTRHARGRCEVPKTQDRVIRVLIGSEKSARQDPSPLWSRPWPLKHVHRWALSLVGHHETPARGAV